MSFCVTHILLRFITITKKPKVRSPQCVHTLGHFYEGSTYTK